MLNEFEVLAEAERILSGGSTDDGGDDGAVFNDVAHYTMDDLLREYRLSEGDIRAMLDEDYLVEYGIPLDWTSIEREHFTNAVTAKQAVVLASEPEPDPRLSVRLRKILRGGEPHHGGQLFLRVWEDIPDHVALNAFWQDVGVEQIERGDQHRVILGKRIVFEATVHRMYIFDEIVLEDPGSSGSVFDSWIRLL